MSNDKRKSFEFRMSKKVAELTQVVHMLFVRNHEKEMELEAVKSAYEEEIAGVIHEAKQLLTTREKEDSKKRDVSQKDLDALQQKHVAELADRQKDAEIKLKGVEGKLIEEKKGSQNLRDCLAMMQKELDSSRTNFHTEKLAWQDTLRTREEALDTTQKRLAVTEKVAKETELRLAEARCELETRTGRLVSETQRLQALAENSRRIKEGLGQRNQELEQEMLNLRREMRRITSGGVDSSLRAADSGGMPYSLGGRQKEDGEREALSDEVEQLRRELLRYKMELFNRDANYNRVFKDQNSTMLVDSRAGLFNSLTSSLTQQAAGVPVLTASSSTWSKQAQQTGGTGLKKSGSGISGGLPREKTFSYVIGQNYDVENDNSDQLAQINKTNVQSNGPKLPIVSSSSQLTSRLQKLSKPQPPNKKAISSF